jgi:hypothetical protein
MDLLAGHEATMSDEQRGTKSVIWGSRFGTTSHPEAHPA